MRLFLDIDQHAGAVEFNCSNILDIDSYKSLGIYVVGNEFPSTSNNNCYFQLKRNGNSLIEIYIKTIEDIIPDSPVYDEEFEIAITKRSCANKDKALSNKCTVPSLGREIIRAFIKDYLNSIENSFKLYKQPNHETNLEKIFFSTVKPEYNSSENYKQFKDLISETLIDIRTDLVKYLGTETWEMLIIEEHTCKVGSGSVLIKSLGDFRIHDWEEKIGSTFKNVSN